MMTQGNRAHLRFLPPFFYEETMLPFIIHAAEENVMLVTLTSGDYNSKTRKMTYTAKPLPMSHPFGKLVPHAKTALRECWWAWGGVMFTHGRCSFGLAGGCCVHGLEYCDKYSKAGGTICAGPMYAAGGVALFVDTVNNTQVNSQITDAVQQVNVPILGGNIPAIGALGSG